MIDLIGIIQNKTRCSNCGGSIKDGTCIFCGVKDDEVSDSINKLIPYLDNIDYLDLNNINQLLKVKDLVSYVDKALIDKHVYDFILTREKELMEKITTQGYLDDESAKDIQFLSVNATNNEMKTFFGLYVVMSNVSKQNHYEESDYLNTIVSFVKSNMEIYTYDADFKIVDFEEKCDTLMGLHEYSGHKHNNKSTITINENEIKRMYEGKSLNGLITIFHEFTHLYQETLIHGALASNPEIIKEVKDHILSIYLPNYYEKNYTNLSFELEAEIKANKMLLNYLDSWKIVAPNREKIEKIINEYQDKFNNYNTRIYNDKEYNLDDLFDKYFMSLNMKSKEFLMKEYPQLKAVYSFNGKEYLKIDKETSDFMINVLSDFTQNRLNNYVTEVNSKKNRY